MADASDEVEPAAHAPALVDELVARVTSLERQVESLRMSDLNRRSFTFRGASYRYVARRPNRTWDNERAVELPIVWAHVERAARADEVLEVGNVLSAYYPVAHRVLDKYESHPKVTWNEDIVEFEPPFEPSLIVSISTLEHVGHSEVPRDPPKFRRAVERVISWLPAHGRLVFTVPLGYNPAVAQYLADPGAGVGEIAYLRRVTADNTWQECSPGEASRAAYGRPFPCANAIAVVYAGGAGAGAG